MVASSAAVTDCLHLLTGALDLVLLGLAYFLSFLLTRNNADLTITAASLLTDLTDYDDPLMTSPASTL
ncbi:hypothetical protein E2562_025398 [Oryza meyeriana var. granulata]|uniref:Uncharacterized protein n=1 Tax=Oryza meyeriana var. granulata TaxID=110450 RepID=A0A6G1D7Y9_9ORYZ|nr:hypothetical protein E2562_025398 [Oryza meyeriana var. granulata]